MKYYLVKILTNDKGQDGTTIAKFDTLETARLHPVLLQ